MLSRQNPLITNFPCDLHCHTTRSDGKDTYPELIDHAVSLGMYAIGITDHDINPAAQITTVEGIEIDPALYAAEHGLTLIPGYEFSTNTWVDDVHICGYGLDWSNPELQAEVEAAARSKTDAYEELCRRLAALGMAIDWEEDILQTNASDGSRVSRRPDKVQRKHIFEAMAVKGYTVSWSAAKLLVRDNPDLNVRRRKIDSIEAIQLIQRCGGVSVLAHPYLIDEKIMLTGQPDMSRADYIETLIEAGLDGIETRYTYDKTTYKGVLSPEQIEVEVRDRYQGRLAILSGGSDYHGRPKTGEKNPRSLGERGLTIEEFESIREFLELKLFG